MQIFFGPITVYRSIIFERFRGKWELKYNEKNTAAKALWIKVTEKYKPQKTKLNDTETVLSFCTT